MKFQILLFLLLFFETSFAQVPDPDYFSPPLKIPMFLAGNFGELRSGHFHSGIDIKTQGRTGLPVYAAADGEVSRINISPSGFGLALYLDHPNGTTTVYGHLSKLRDDLAVYARSIQYEKQSFRVDISIPKGKFVVKKGDLIAYSGNSGSSGGPHLHFEIRDTRSEKPQNPLLYHFNIQDDLAPKIVSVMFYPLSDEAQVSGKISPQLIETVFYDGAYHLKSNPVVPVYGEIGFGIQTLDYLDGSWSKCGVYEIDLSVDDHPVYTFRMDQLSFDETRYVNSQIDYAYYQHHHRRLHKSWVESGNKLHNYPLLVNQGKVELSDGQLHEVSYRISDAKGNSSKLDFSVLSKQIQVERPKPTGIFVPWNKSFTIQKEGLTADFTEHTFYSGFWLDYREKPSNNLYFSPIFQLHHSDVPVHQSFDLRIRADKLPPRLAGKALIAVIDEQSGQKWAAGGNYSHGWVEANVRQLGSFAVSVDTVAPTIIPLNIQNSKVLTDKTRISFKIRDDFSGIADYTGKIDGHWVLFEYDSKNDLIEYYFDPDRLETGKNHHLELVVGDAKENTRTYEADFYR